MVNEILIGIIVSIAGFLAYRIYLIETNHLTHIEKDMAQTKTDISWIKEILKNHFGND